MRKSKGEQISDKGIATIHLISSVAAGIYMLPVVALSLIGTIEFHMMVAFFSIGILLVMIVIPLLLLLIDWKLDIFDKRSSNREGE